MTSADLTSTTPGRNIFHDDSISSYSSSAQEIVTVRENDAGTHILEVDDYKNAGWSFLIKRIG